MQKLLKEEIAPGFEALIRASVEVICDLMSTLELPRVDGVYDSPLGSVCYHVDDLAFSEFVVAKDGLHVQNQTGENGEQAGFGSTVSIEGIRTKMNNIRFAYCEYPKSWGVVDGEGLCTVKVDGEGGHLVTSSPTPRSSCESSTTASSSPRTRRRWPSSGTRSRSDSREEARRRTRRTTPQLDADAATAAPNPEAPRRTSVDSFHSAGSAADALSPKATKSSPHTPKPTPRWTGRSAVASLAAAARRREDREEDDEYAAEASGSSWGWGVDSFSMFGGGDDAAAALQREATASDAASGAGGSSSARERNSRRRSPTSNTEKLERIARCSRSSRDEFIIERPVVELRVHARPSRWDSWTWRLAARAAWLPT